MTRFSCKVALGTLCAAVATAAAAGQATIYSDRGFQGRAITLTGSDPDIANHGFDDVGSIVVHSGRWEFCARRDFRGQCESLGPGSYYSLREDWSHRVLSVRDTTEAHAQNRPSVELYPRRQFRGTPTAIERDVRRLERRGVDEREVSSIVVNEGVWELCTEPRFRGECAIFQPGHYGRLGPALNNQVSSMRRVG
jgi:hypothetical protein